MVALWFGFFGFFFNVLYKIENFQNIFYHSFSVSLLIIYTERKSNMRRHSLLLLLKWATNFPICK